MHLDIHILHVKTIIYKVTRLHKCYTLIWVTFRIYTKEYLYGYEFFY